MIGEISDEGEVVQLIPISDVVFRGDLYPRFELSIPTVEQYVEALDNLPPIELNQHKELIDGRHRWTAHKEAGRAEVPAIITQTSSDMHLLELAIERNAKFGLQLSQRDKRDMAVRLYGATPMSERQDKKTQLAALLSVPDRTLRGWLSRTDKEDKEKRNQRIWDMWLACYTQEQIAEAVGLTHRGVGQVLEEMADLPKVPRLLADFAEPDWKPPIYNVWKWQEKTAGATHFGNSEPTIVENLLYLYTQPLDVVIDPFGGGGSTVDVCKKRSRRYWVSDRLVRPKVEGKIRQADATALPGPTRKENTSLVYLDPPYWRQAQGQYSQDSDDLANMPLEQFTDALASIIRGYLAKGIPHVAVLIQPTQWNTDEHHTYTDHVADLIRAVDAPIDIRVSCPYESQQCNAQMVEWSKRNRRLLVLSRELVVFRCA